MTTHTAKIINENHHKLIVPIDYLKERNYKELNENQFNSIDLNKYWNYYSNINYGTENIYEFFDRVFQFIEYLKTKTNYNDILIVTHNSVSKAFTAYFDSIPKDGQFINLGIKDCEIKKYILNKY